MKPLVLFDMDGTLIFEGHPRHNGTEKHPLPEVPIKTQMKQIAISHGVPMHIVEPLNRMALIWNATRRYMEKNSYPEEKVRTVMHEINGPFLADERADHEYSILIPDTISCLRSLQEAGYEMGLVTTASRESYHRISCSSEYGCFGVYFAHSVTRDDVDYIKPDPEPINKILELYDNDRFVYIGDTDHDAMASKAANGVFVLINTRNYDTQVLKKLQPDAVINRLTELPDVLDHY
jgi:phosphoglycolate phosphatase-like HAD superfamily hydrolase